MMMIRCFGLNVVGSRYSLTDLITAAAVKKAYRIATLCIHPDKVQQKGATLQQKYIAEKVFDLLKLKCSRKDGIYELKCAVLSDENS